jgi:16S rRNA (cytidine1402-2'-O)-methyltransferase
MTTVVYEAPHRVARTLADLTGACGSDRPVVLVREVTKLHEEVWRGSLGEGADRVRTAPEPPRGEWVIVIAGRGPGFVGAASRDDGGGIGATATDEDIVMAVRARLREGKDRRQAVIEVASDLRVPKRRVYNLSIGPSAPAE